ncbi:MAG: hypothetical protein KC619_20030 [Myxococcales bacterium]|nr:hypothetical protein [Myxococcales bacterium]
MPGRPVVARVLLVAHPARQETLAACLRVVGEAVTYELQLAEPAHAPLDRPWDVIVIDGESVAAEPERLRVLRLARRQPRATVLYVCSRLPHARELEHAALADDYVYSGWAESDRVRRRVQVVALAPWRRGVEARTGEGRPLGSREAARARCGGG